MSFWQMVPNIEMEDMPVIKFKAKKFKRKTKSEKSISNDSNPQLEYESIIESEISHDTVVDRRPEYVEHRLLQQMFLDSRNRFQHIICTVVKDKSTGKY